MHSPGFNSYWAPVSGLGWRIFAYDFGTAAFYRADLRAFSGQTTLVAVGAAVPPLVRSVVSFAKGIRIGLDLLLLVIW